MTIEFFHNPRCSKSRAVLELLERSGNSFEVIEYLQGALREDQLTSILDALDQPPAALVRTNNDTFRGLGVDSEDLNQDAVTKILIQHPELFQRPVVMTDGKARIGRPPECILELIG